MLAVSTDRPRGRGAAHGKEQTIGTRRFQAAFAGSVFELNRLPRDRRPQVAVAGRSNVGKSSLLNALFGRKKLAKVSATPGKTRCLNFFLVDNRFYLVDLPGYGYARVPRTVSAAWGRLLQEYLHTCEDLVGLILLLDSRRDLTEEDRRLLHWLAHRGLPAMLVLTKADKVNRDTIKRRTRELEHALRVPVIAFSTVTGEGKHELMASVLDLVNAPRRKSD